MPKQNFFSNSKKFKCCLQKLNIPTAWILENLKTDYERHKLTKSKDEIIR